jgi:CHASE3 domain sensor protein
VEEPAVDDISQSLQELTTLQHELERSRGQQQAQIDQAEDKLREALALMREEFGTGSIEEARQQLAEMELQLQEEIGSLTERLREAAQ